MMVVRGGSYAEGFEVASTIHRERRPRKEVTDDIGFRMVIECPEGPPDPQ
jgi:hypothetical protein